MNRKEVKISKRNSAYVVTNDFDPGYTNQGDFIEITEWTNGDGIDININRTSPAGINLGGTIKFQITYGEFEAIKKCIDSIQNL